MNFEEITKKYASKAGSAAFTLALLFLVAKDSSVDSEEFDRLLTVGDDHASAVVPPTTQGGGTTVTTKAIANNASTNLFTLPIANNSVAAFTIDWHVEGFDGTDLISFIGRYAWNIINKAGVIDNKTDTNTFFSYEGTYTNDGTGTFALTNPHGLTFSNTTVSSPITFSVNPGNLGSTFSGGYLNIHYTLNVLTGQTPTYL